MSLVQLTRRTGIVRAPAHHYGQPIDLIELDLEPNQRVVQVETKRGLDERRRKTVDWTWTVWIETRLGDSEP